MAEPSNCVYFVIDKTLIDELKNETCDDCLFEHKNGNVSIENIKETDASGQIEVVVEGGFARSRGRNLFLKSIKVHIPSTVYDIEDVVGDICIVHEFDNNTNLNIYIPLREGDSKSIEDETDRFFKSFIHLSPGENGSGTFNLDDMIPKDKYYWAQGMERWIQNPSTVWECTPNTSDFKLSETIFFEKSLTINTSTLNILNCKDVDNELKYRGVCPNLLVPHIFYKEEPDVKNTNVKNTNRNRIIDIFSRSTNPPKGPSSVFTNMSEIECTEQLEEGDDEEEEEEDLMKSPLIQAMLGMSVAVGVAILIKSLFK